jgi:multidrug efflux pump subunit AcrB
VTALAEFSLTPGYGSINHLDGRRINEIKVYIPAGELPSRVLTEFQKRLAESDFVVPVGYTLTFGGEAAKRNEAVGNLMASVGILVVMMIATLVLSFGSFRVASIVGFVGILSVGLGLGALWLFGFSFGFMAIIGTMGLMGVAINDTIVVLAAIRSDGEAAAGDPTAMRDVVLKATRHIVSTSLTTMAGFTPLILEGGGFWPPLAVAIAGGVGGATVLALFLVPSCYLLLMCKRPQPAIPSMG